MTKKQANLLKKINEASNLISRVALKGSGQFIICSSQLTEAILNLDPAYRKEIRKKKLEQIKKNLNDLN